MKKISLILIAVLSFSYSYSQNTYPWISTGNIGIGTTAPRAVLDIGKTLTVGELGTVMARLSEGNSEGTGTYLGVKGYTTSGTGSASNIKSFAIEHSFYGVINSSINFFRGGDRMGGSISINTNNNIEAMRILSNGNVGIGISSPAEKLAVNGTIRSKEVKVDMIGWPDYVFQPDYDLRTLPDLKAYLQKYHRLPEFPSEVEVAEKGLSLGEMNKLLTKKVEELSLYLIKLNEEMEAIKKRLPSASM